MERPRKNHNRRLFAARQQSKTQAQPIAQALEYDAETRIAKLIGIADWPNRRLVIESLGSRCRLYPDKTVSSKRAFEEHFSGGRNTIHCPYCRVLVAEYNKHNPVKVKRRKS